MLSKVEQINSSIQHNLQTSLKTVAMLYDTLVSVICAVVNLMVIAEPFF